MCSYFTTVVRSPRPRLSAMMSMTRTTAPSSAQNRQSETKLVVSVVVVVVLDEWLALALLESI